MAEEKTRREHRNSERRDVIRTLKAIDTAYYELLFRKNKEKITVTDVIKEADISRGTFYAYYSDIPDLNEHFEDMVVSLIRDSLSGLSFREIVGNPRPFVSEIIDRVSDHRTGLFDLIKKNDDARITSKIKLTLIRAISDSLESDDKAKKDIAIVSVVGAAVDSSIHWVLDEDKISREELEDFLCTFISGGLIGLVE